MIIRKLQLEDIDEVCVMEEEAFSMPWHKESFIDMINNPDALYLAAIDTCVSDDASDENAEKTVVLGCAGVISVIGEGDICNIVVRADRRGQGIGKSLVTELIRRGEEEHGIKAYTLEVRESNAAAIHLYESLGFVSAGKRPGFYDKPKEDALIMWRR